MAVSPRRRGLWQWSRTATGAPSAVPRTPARLAGWVVREAVLALAGEGGTGLAARTARDRRHREKSPSPWLGARGDAGGGSPPAAPWPSSPRLWRERGWRSPRTSGLPVEQAGHRAVAEHLADRAAQQRGDREHRELVEPLLLRHRQRVRKSTRLNSSHSQISYAVFCLKK